MKTKSFSVLFSVLFSLLFLVLGHFFPIGAENVNLAPNSSFEDGVDSPLYWETITSSSCNNSSETTPLNFEWSSGVVKSGNHSLSIENVLPSNTSWIPGKWISNKFTYVKNSLGQYSIGTWVFVSDNGILPAFWICTFDISDNFRRESRLSSTTSITPGTWTWIESTGFNFIGVEKVKIGLGVICNKNSLDNPCTGSNPGNIAFDNVSLRPIGAITAHKFEDLNQNMVQDPHEQNMSWWEISLHREYDCINSYFSAGWTNPDGNLIFSVESSPTTPLSPGNYSVLETLWIVPSDEQGNLLRPTDGKLLGWKNTTQLCQNVILTAGESPVVHFGNIRGPTVPYFSQLDPIWNAKEYDHGNSIGPFFCGTTIGGCGCAITSAAMLLKYHGATKAPDGTETNPENVNTWLINNKGYAFGALKWNSIAAYSVKANQNFQTQKIRFTGVGAGNNYSLLDTELSNNKPTILEETGHFILATGKQSPTYKINDPAYQNRKTLESYSNSFRSMRRYEKTNTDLSSIYLSTPAPNDLFIIDAQGRRTGKDPQTGQEFTEIPNSFYFLEPEFSNQTMESPQVPPENSGVNMLVVLTPEKGSFNFSTGPGDVDVSFYDQSGEINQTEFRTDSPKTLNISYSPIPGENNNFFQEINLDVEPTSTQNRIYPKSGTLEVLVKKSSQFNPAHFDIPTATLGNNQIHPYKFKNSKKGLSLYFKVRDLYLSESERTLCLQGQDINGIPLKGCDFIKVHR